VSNIFTDFVRVYPQHGHLIDRVEAMWITWALLGPRGSYHVPVVTQLGPEGSYADIQYGSGKSADIVDFCEDNVGYRYRAVWGRRFDEGGDEDVIWQDDVNAGPRRYCRYGFDEVRVVSTGEQPPVAAELPWRRGSDGSWRLPVAGSYRTGNDRAAEVGAAAVPGDVPVPRGAGRSGEPLLALDPPRLGPLADRLPGVALVDFSWRGRLVHRAGAGRNPEGAARQGPPAAQDWAGGDPEGDGWRHHCADGWDNCLDPDFLRFTGATQLLAADQAYQRDRQDWQSRG
jgi:hypothetical protein